MAAVYKEQLGEAIKRRRKALGLSQAELADRIPVKESTTVSRWERGERGPNDLEAVATALQTTAVEMLKELRPIGQTDRRRLNIKGGTQLDRIEEKLEEILSRLPEVPAGQAERARGARHLREAARPPEAPPQDETGQDTDAETGNG